MKIKLLLAALLASTPAAALAEWREAETAHFRIITEQNDKDLARFAHRLEAVNALMMKANGTKPPRRVNKVRVYVVPGLDDVERAIDAVGSGVAGFYTINEDGPLAVIPRRTGADYGTFTPELVLFHEYGHHFQLQYYQQAYPGWYVEGTAELYATAEVKPDGTVMYGKAASHRGQSLSYARWVPIETLLIQPADKYPNDGDYYGQSWLLTHYLTFAPQRKGQLGQYLRALVSGKSPKEAAAIFGDLNKLSGEVRKYFEAANFPYRAVKLDLPAEVIRKTRPLSRAEAELISETIAYRDYDLSEIEKSKDRTKEVADRKKYVDRLRKKVARLGADPYALRLLADAEFLVGDFSASRANVARLLAVDPKNVGGLYRQAMLLLRDAEAASGSERSKLALQARALAIKAHNIDNYDPQPLLAYYRSFPLAGEKADAETVNLVADALLLVPQDTRTRWTLVEALASTGRYKEAIVQIGPLAFDPHKSPSRERALKRLEELKKAAAATA